MRSSSRYTILHVLCICMLCVLYPHGVDADTYATYVSYAKSSNGKFAFGQDTTTAWPLEVATTGDAAVVNQGSPPWTTNTGSEITITLGSSANTLLANQFMTIEGCLSVKPNANAANPLKFGFVYRKSSSNAFTILGKHSSGEMKDGAVFQICARVTIPNELLVAGTIITVAGYVSGSSATITGNDISNALGVRYSTHYITLPAPALPAYSTRYTTSGGFTVKSDTNPPIELLVDNPTNLATYNIPDPGTLPWQVTPVNAGSATIYRITITNPVLLANQFLLVDYSMNGLVTTNSNKNVRLFISVNGTAGNLASAVFSQRFIASSGTNKYTPIRQIFMIPNFYIVNNAEIRIQAITDNELDISGYSSGSSFIVRSQHI